MVATPIGNLADITYRAVQILAQVDRVLAEDTRRTGILLRHYGISARMQAFHEHNEAELAPRALEMLREGMSLALVSDAGTPLLSDPGFGLVRGARQLGIAVVPVPGPNAALCALSASGLPPDRVLLLGFAPRARAQRRSWLADLAQEPSTLVFYESGHRILDSLGDASELLGASRRAVVARELTKIHETFLQGSLGDLLACLEADPDQRRGEFVVLVEGEPVRPGGAAADGETIIRVLAAELPTKRAADLTAKIVGGSRKGWYRRALEVGHSGLG